MAAAGWRRIKKLRTYTYEEAARKLRVSTRTVQEWVRKRGLRAYTDQRPHIIVGEDLIAFLCQRAEIRKVPLCLIQFFCLRCRAAREPAFGMVDYDLSRPGAVAVMAICAVCETTMKKRISRARLSDFRHSIAVRSTQAQQRLKRAG